MYAVSNAYKAQMKKNVLQRKLRGTINEVVPFTDDDILDGSFTLTNQCMDTSSFGYGGVYIAELHLTFVTERVYDRKNWKGKRLFIEDGLYIDADDDYEYVPLGHFRVAEANYTTWGLEIKAYDLMAQFDQEFFHVQTDGVPYDLATLACQQCNVVMAQTRTDFNKVCALPTNELLVQPDGIETWRDFLSYLCQACNMYCTMDRDGALSFRKIMPAQDSLVDTPTDTIGMDERFDDGVFSDFTTSYTGIQATFTGGEETVVKMYGSSKGVVIDFGVNPMLQGVIDDDTTGLIGKLQTDIAQTETAIEVLEGEIDSLKDQIAYVEQQIHDHPEDKSLPKLLEQLKATLADKGKQKEDLEKYKTETEETLAKVQQGLVDHSIDVLSARLEFLAADLQSIQYTPATVSMLGDPAYDLGDVIRFEGGLAGGECDLNIMRFDYTFGARYTVETFGESPSSNGAKSKDAKSAASKDGSGNSGKIDFIKYINASEYDFIGESLDNEIARVKFGVRNQCDVEEWTEIKMTTVGNTTIKLHYYLDGEEIAAYMVEDSFSAGSTEVYWDNSDGLVINTSTSSTGIAHTVNYHYHLPEISPNTYHSWLVSMDVLEGEVHIETGDIHEILWSQGMIGNGGWKGLIQASDEYPVYPINGLNIGTLADDVAISGPASESADLYTEDNNNLITEDGNNIITE